MVSKIFSSSLLFERLSDKVVSIAGFPTLPPLLHGPCTDEPMTWTSALVPPAINVSESPNEIIIIINMLMPAYQ
jgi:hypothetical protein